MNANLHLPPIRLEDLPGRTKDFVLAFCNQHDCTPRDALKAILDSAAQRAGFPPSNSTGGTGREVVMHG